jgi:NAD(P)-dependent dehydrogenase (short-subunit alcohol dehydrogenase family)
MGRIDFDDLQGTRNYSGQRAYSQSKLANIMFTSELARHLDGSGVTAASLHPASCALTSGPKTRPGISQPLAAWSGPS